ncbi:hypothetical protein SLEP1_g48958 [Rubroshorea leprosula]|uniref:Transposase n=1 Tax=Rubroshorea leprosula TaxID=152421 RepID=A0AAV5LV80_9ROSI|nr:hypothetical protein SLEP1_g48958 [Rubroshorea leprosula]
MRSVKRIKDTNANSVTLPTDEAMVEVPNLMLSYRDKLLLDGVPEEANVDLSSDAIPEFLEEELDVDDDPNDPRPIVLFSKEEKMRMREPWKNSLIIKTISKIVGYNFLYSRIKAQWKATTKKKPQGSRSSNKSAFIVSPADW